MYTIVAIIAVYLAGTCQAVADIEGADGLGAEAEAQVSLIGLQIEPHSQLYSRYEGIVL